ncbi:transposase [Actinomadura sp. SCN-SB]|uniref:transposase n=1 Tax=Actinomadura sp. SCN-SB TaxID=3373092 RepID=UPI0037524683
MPGAAWQRCRTRYLRNLLTRAPKSAQPWVATLVRTIFGQPAPEEARLQHARVVDGLTAKPSDAPNTRMPPATTRRPSPDCPQAGLWPGISGPCSGEPRSIHRPAPSGLRRRGG